SDVCSSDLGRAKALGRTRGQRRWVENVVCAPGGRAGGKVDAHLARIERITAGVRNRRHKGQDLATGRPEGQSGAPQRVGLLVRGMPRGVASPSKAVRAL